MKAKCIVLWYETEAAKISAGSLPWPTVKGEAAKPNSHCGAARVDGTMKGQWLR